MIFLGHFMAGQPIPQKYGFNETLLREPHWLMGPLRRPYFWGGYVTGGGGVG